MTCLARGFIWRKRYARQASDSHFNENGKFGMNRNENGLHFRRSSSISTRREEATHLFLRRNCIKLRRQSEKSRWHRRLEQRSKPGRGILLAAERSRRRSCRPATCVAGAQHPIRAQHGQAREISPQNQHALESHEDRPADLQPLHPPTALFLSFTLHRQRPSRGPAEQPVETADHSQPALREDLQPVQDRSECHPGFRDATGRWIGLSAATIS